MLRIVDRDEPDLDLGLGACWQGGSRDEHGRDERG